MDSQSRADRIRFEPADLARHPEVNALLESTGLGRFVADTVTSPFGRNESWMGTTDRGEKVFVKTFDPPGRDERLRRTLTFAERAARAGIATPRVLGHAESTATVAFELLDEPRSLLELFTASQDAGEDFDTEWCLRAARLVAETHRLAPDGFDTSAHPLPPLGPMNALTLRGYLGQSGAELHMWRLLHNDPEVLAAVTAMKEADGPGVGVWVPIHGDVRLDQFLVSGDTLYLTDAEESRLGDPARDIGAFAGEWLYHAINRIPTVLSESHVVGHVPTHQEIVATGAAEVDRFAPRTRAFFAGYLAHAGLDASLHDDLAVRAARYAGWHMIDRMISIARQKQILAAVPRAAAGIGRSLLLDPRQFLDTIGLRIPAHAA
ncbi:class V lanthionine synthetase subunit LxmK [Streptomyces montanisoli]|uniref:Class IV lanthionine synthetase subunit LxmK n=1 Tax=Streptomyces montanisoli TaxID=2798581 RepID=A0A940RYH6_9ACTN|nr:class V lanthionine synthetase subunit LxmK [Streptomyces montanisoli]MBP0458694.1 class IV lanthionine synthetase subunit LxmK [Streptomyces montanisoli]